MGCNAMAGSPQHIPKDGHHASRKKYTSEQEKALRA
jgi:hypothetical protein